ncbi:hypothetical protein TNCV_580191, partial [Trichonephila clavipes]
QQTDKSIKERYKNHNEEISSKSDIAGPNQRFRLICGEQ